MNIYIRYAVFTLLCGVLFDSCSFDDTVADFSNIHDAKSSQYIPNSPYNLSISQYSDTFIKLRWTDDSQGEQGFIIERSDSVDNKFIPIDTTETDVSSYTDNFNVRLGINYYYRIRAFRSQNKSVYSSTAETRVDLKDPTNLQIYMQSKTDNLLISWSDLNQYDRTFVLQYRIPAESSEFTTLAKVSLPYKSYTLNSLDTNKVYEFRVYIETKQNVSGYSNILSLIYGLYSSSNTGYGSYQDARYVDFSPVVNQFVATGTDYYSTPFNVYGVGSYSEDYGASFQIPGSFIAGYSKFNHSGKVLAVGNSDLSQSTTDNTIYFIDAVNKRVMHRHWIGARTLDFSPDDSRLAFGCDKFTDAYPNNVGVMDLSNYKTIWFNSNYSITHVKMTPDGKKVMAVQSLTGGDKILIFDAADGTLLNTLEPNSNRIWDIELSPDGTMFAFSTNESSPDGGRIQIWDLNSFSRIRQIDAFAVAISFTHDSKYLAAGYRNIRLYRTSDCFFMGFLGAKELGNYILSLSFSHNDTFLAAGRYSPPAVFKITKGWHSL